jgi:hypothetical protein
MKNIISSTPLSFKFAALFSWSQISDYLSSCEKTNKLSYSRRLLRVCLVKTTACTELYNLVNASSIKQLIFSTVMRAGPVGLIQSLNADFRIVHTVSDHESQAFMTRRIRLKKYHPETLELSIKQQTILSTLAVNVEDVDWGEYDLVVAVENAIPSRVAIRYPQVIFASMIEDHRLDDYQRYRRKLPEGYRLFLNLRTGPSPHDFVKRPWEIDFTYGFREAHSLSKLLPCVKKKNIIHLEGHEDPVTNAILEKLTGMQVVQYSESVMGFYELIRSAKYFVSVNPRRPLGGLAAIDAISADTLVIANRHKIWNAHPICNELHVSNIYGAAKIINDLNAKDKLYEEMLLMQSTLLQYYCYDRPLAQILNHFQ